MNAMELKGVVSVNEGKTQNGGRSSHDIKSKLAMGLGLSDWWNSACLHLTHEPYDMTHNVDQQGVRKRFQSPPSHLRIASV